MGAENEKIIDLKLGTMLAVGKRKLALRILRLLAEGLPEIIDRLKQSFEYQDLEALHEVVHKLHGGAAYCGTPRLKRAAFQFEEALDHEGKDLRPFYEALLKEIDLFQKEFELLGLKV